MANYCSNKVCVSLYLTDGVTTFGSAKTKVCKFADVRIRDNYCGFVSCHPQKMTTASSYQNWHILLLVKCVTDVPNVLCKIVLVSQY